MVQTEASEPSRHGRLSSIHTVPQNTFCPTIHTNQHIYMLIAKLSLIIPSIHLVSITYVTILGMKGEWDGRS